MSKTKEMKVGQRYPAGKPNLFVRLRADGSKAYTHRIRVAGEKDRFKPLDATTLEAAYREAVKKYPPGEYVPVANANAKFSKELWKQFCDTKKSESTRRAYEKVWRLYLADALIGKHVAKLRPVTVIAITEHLQEQGRSVSTVARTQWALSAFYKWARDEGLCTHNPVRDLPTHKKVKFVATKEVTPEDILSEEQLARMAAAARAYGPKGEMYATIIELAPLLGLRISEMLALHWHHIEGRHLHVRAQLAEKFNPAEPASWFRALKGKAEKSHGRTRKIVLSQAAIEILARYRTWAFSQGLYRHDGLLFPTFSHTPMRQDQLAEVVRSTAATAGITRPVVFHHFRHIRASRLFDMRFGYDYVAQQLGDSPEVIRATYVTFINDEGAVSLYDELEAAQRERLAS